MKFCANSLWIVAAILVLSRCEDEECEQIVKLKLKDSLSAPSLHVRLLLYTRSHPSCGKVLSRDNPQATPTFNISNPFTFLIHGYRPTGSPPIWMNHLVEGILNRSDINVIVVDWNRGAANVNYLRVVKNTRLVAANLTAFIRLLQSAGSSLSSVHMIGVSLGAHISGFTGAEFNGSIGRITALDPAGPMFKGKSPADRLDPSDAGFVDAVHTDMDALGYREPIGHIDYYANGGADQPGCPRSLFSGSQYFKCDHQRSVLLFLDSVTNACRTVAYPCSDYDSFLDGKCLSCEGFDSLGCPLFGYDVIRWKEVLLQRNQTSTYFSTNAAPPFCRTNYKLEIVSWNSEPRWGTITITLRNRTAESSAHIDHKFYKFERFSETVMLAQFERDVQNVDRITLKYHVGTSCSSRYKLRVLRFRLTPLENGVRPMCRYDLLLEENQEVTFRPITCADSNF